jgi:hypothetical protein
MVVVRGPGVNSQGSWVSDVMMWFPKADIMSDKALSGTNGHKSTKKDTNVKYYWKQMLARFCCRAMMLQDTAPAFQRRGG